MEVEGEDIHEKKQELQHTVEPEDLEPCVPKHVEEDQLDDGVLAIAVVKSEMCDVISEMLSNHEEHVYAILVPTKVEVFVEFDGHKIFK